MSKQCKCPMCNSNAWLDVDISAASKFYSCPVCGRIDLQMNLDTRIDEVQFDRNHLAAFLVYNGYKNELAFYTNRSKEWVDKVKEEFHKGNREHGLPVYLDNETVENWYPKTFAEKIDRILLYFGDHIKHVGESLTLKKEELYSVLFVDRFDYDQFGKPVERGNGALKSQADFMLNYLKDQSYIKSLTSANWWNTSGDEINLQVLPTCYARIDLLQKNNTHGKDAFVAMKFGDDTIKLREAIHEGIKNAGYKPILIDEVEHNEFIIPELLKHIKDSKFVVVDLTHQNNGAYFEEGYALGLGKPVIQLCKSTTKLHFDVAQKNTIMWETEEDIPERLEKRIKATID